MQRLATSVRIGLIAALLRSSLASGQDPAYQFGITDGSGGTVAEVSMTFDNLGEGVLGWSAGVCHDDAEFEILSVTPGETTEMLNPDYVAASTYAGGWTVEVVVSFFTPAVLPPGEGYELHRAFYQLPPTPGAELELCFCDTLGTPTIDTGVIVDGFLVTTVTSCGSITVTDAEPEELSFIYSVESLTGMIDSAEELLAALDHHGETAVVIEELPAPGSLPIRSVWALFGTFPHNQVMTPAEGAFLVGLVQQGIPVYVEGSDLWGFDPPTAFAGYDGVHGPSAGNGDDSFLGMVGFDFAAARLAGLDAAYTQDSAGNDSTDRIRGTPVDLAGSNAGVIWRDDGSGGATTGYGTGVFYDTDPGFGKVLCQSWEFGGYGGDHDLLAARYLEALGLLTVLRSPFRRADANGDGTVDIADALFIEGVLFSGGAPSVCDDANDANDDGIIDIADEIFILSFLFASGPTPPAPGPDRCGPDATTDVLSCNLYDACP